MFINLVFGKADFPCISRHNLAGSLLTCYVPIASNLIFSNELPSAVLTYDTKVTFAPYIPQIFCSYQSGGLISGFPTLVVNFLS